MEIGEEGRRFMTQPRAILHFWDDTPGLVDVKVCKGNGWRPRSQAEMFEELVPKRTIPLSELPAWLEENYPAASEVFPRLSVEN